jgi:Mg-chelatase subunit ChlD
MPSRLQRVVSFGIPSTAVATIVAAALLTPWTRPAAPPDPTPGPGSAVAGPGTAEPHVDPARARAIDVVFAVDTTGSMAGLIEGAKRTVWSIATHIRQTEPNADLRVGLVAYRDVSDDYVTRPFPLTSDLDAVSAELRTYAAAGGGDFPEHIAAALRDAVAMQWRPGAKKLVFVVGDAPPAVRGDTLPHDHFAREAASLGITINTVRCGSQVGTAIAFEQLAQLGGGEYSSIAQDGGVHQVATPYDERLAAVSARIDATAVIAGDAPKRAAYRAKLEAAAGASAETKADRASYYAKKARVTRGGADVRDADDLVGALAAGSLDLERVAPAALPDDLRGKSREEITAELARRSAERAAAQRELAELARQRDEYLSRQGSGASGFDGVVKATVEKQLK